MGELITPDYGVPEPAATEPRVLCASCGRSRDKAPREDGPMACADPDWHQPQLPVPDLDVTAEDGDSLAPETEADLLAAVGPEPGRTWAELYAKAALQLSYRTAELRGAERELERLRGQQHTVPVSLQRDQAVVVAAMIRRLTVETCSGSDRVRLTPQELHAVEDRRLAVFLVEGTGELVLEVEPR